MLLIFLLLLLNFFSAVGGDIDCGADEVVLLFGLDAF
jgi:hypothetical protein